MAKADRVLALLEALQDHPFAVRAAAGRAARHRRAHAAPRRGRAARARHPRRGRARPRRRLPAEARLPDAAADVHARRGDGGRARAARRPARRGRRGSALAKLRRVLPDRVRLRVEALEDDAALHRPRPGRRARRGPALARRGGAARPPRHAPLHDLRRRDGAARAQPYGLVAHAGRWYVPAYDHGREALRAFRADRFGAVRMAAAASRRPRASTPSRSSPARSPASPRPRGRGGPAHATDAPFPPSLAELEPDPRRARALRMRADSLDWVAGLLASAGCEFTRRRARTSCAPPSTRWASASP